LDGIGIAGWEDVIGPSRASEVFEMVDAAVASLFEERPSVSPITREELLQISWKGLSESLSLGTHVSRSGSSVRPVGLTEAGHLILYSESGVEVVDEMRSLSWVA